MSVLNYIREIIYSNNFITASSIDGDSVLFFIPYFAQKRVSDELKQCFDIHYTILIQIQYLAFF